MGFDGKDETGWDGVRQLGMSWGKQELELELEESSRSNTGTGGDTEGTGGNADRPQDGPAGCHIIRLLARHLHSQSVDQSSVSPSVSSSVSQSVSQLVTQARHGQLEGLTRWV